MPELTRNQRHAIHLFGAHTAGAFTFWQLAGSPKASCRAAILSALRGMRVVQAKAGVTALRDAFAEFLLEPAERAFLCAAAAEDTIARLCRESGAYTPGRCFVE